MAESDLAQERRQNIKAIAQNDGARVFEGVGGTIICIIAHAQ